MWEIIKNILIRGIQGLPLPLLLPLHLHLHLHLQLTKNLSVQRNNMHLINMLKIYFKKIEKKDINIRFNIKNSLSNNLNRLNKLFKQKN
jgi:hypothetical protein